MYEIEDYCSSHVVYTSWYEVCESGMRVLVVSVILESLPYVALEWTVSLNPRPSWHANGAGIIMSWGLFGGVSCRTDRNRTPICTSKGENMG